MFFDVTRCLKFQGDAQRRDAQRSAMFENGPHFNVRSQSIQPKSWSVGHILPIALTVRMGRVVFVKLAIWFQNPLKKSDSVN